MDLALRIADITTRIAESCTSVGRSPDGVQLMAVSKTQSQETVKAAVGAGLTLFGENRVAEGRRKFEHLRGCEVHLIGHLQRNKARDVPGGFSCVQSIDKTSTTRALDTSLRGSDDRLAIYLEVNTSGDEAKFGVRSFAELRALVDEVLPLERLDVAGLMTIAPFTDDERRRRSAFARLFEMRERLTNEVPELAGLRLSMGMSNDFEDAIKEGSDMVRIGTLLFGARA